MRWNTSQIKKARKIKEKPNLEFLLELLSDECDRKHRNIYLKSAKFDVVNTFKHHIYYDNYFHNLILVDKIKCTKLVPKHETI
ncbi:hypothetical protein FACS1894219_04520 [Clostridia bacterium]|nr:hypothetical protein FACS1894219_04520 [Clostridia bacterium]